jgi:hypothetical protein
VVKELSDLLIKIPYGLRDFVAKIKLDVKTKPTIQNFSKTVPAADSVDETDSVAYTSV